MKIIPNIPNIPGEDSMAGAALSGNVDTEYGVPQRCGISWELMGWDEIFV